MKILYGLTALLLFHVFTISALAQQSENISVMKPIHQLFLGMKTGDSALVHDAFLPNAAMYTSSEDKYGKPKLRKGDLQSFLNAVGSQHDLPWNEEIWDVEIKVDQNLAVAWVPYAFYLGNQFIHCGTNVVLLQKNENAWKIYHISDTRKTKNCTVPKKILKKYTGN